MTRWALLAIRGMAFWIAFTACIWGFQAASQSPETLIDRNATRVAEMDRRITTLESQKLDARMAVMETIIESNSRLLQAIFISIGLLVLEAGYRLVGTIRTRVQHSARGGG